MSKTIVNALLLLLVLVPAQAVIFNNLAVFGVALPLVFIYVLITLPVTTVLAFMRRPVLHLYLPLDDELGPAPLGLRSLGPENYLKYMLTMVLLYCFLVFTVEAFELFNLRLWILRIVCSTIYTFIFIYAFASLASRTRREKKL